MRSLLFVPADGGRKLDKAMASGADAVIVDLEDSISVSNKATARKSAADFVKGSCFGPWKFQVDRIGGMLEPREMA